MRRLRTEAPALLLGLPVVGLFIVWAVHNGGYDEDTWYWGALVLLCLLIVTLVALRRWLRPPTRVSVAALTLFTLYVCWSYLSILWAQSPGTALEGSNRALLYLLVFALMLAIPWTSKAALVALLVFVVGIGAIAAVLLLHLAIAGNVAPLFVGGRLAAPTGYINATAALMMMGALPSIVLASRRELPAPLRGLLLAFATAELQLALSVQSRGWLFTLPLVAIAAIVLVPGRLRVTAAAVLPAAGTAIVARRLLRVYQDAPSDPLTHLAHRAAPAALLACAAVFFVGTLVAWGDGSHQPRPLSRGVSGAIGVMLAAAAVAAGFAVGLIVSHDHPGRYVSQQWHGFAHQRVTPTSSHFTDVGSGRYDFWRVSLDAFKAHPVGGIGMDNFADYYSPRSRSGENPAWPHSLELRLLAMTGIVGTVLFAGFIVLAFVAAIKARRRGPPLHRVIVAAAMLPVIEWLIHGSVDWFWELPALSGPALGFLAVACSLSVRRSSTMPDDPSADERPDRSQPPSRGRPVTRVLVAGAGVLAAAAAATVLVFPYLSVREVSTASEIQTTDPQAALHDLSLAADLNPLDADPDRLAGAIALRTGQYHLALQRFERSLVREPGGWFSRLGAGLAESELGHRKLAHHDYTVAHSLYGNPAVIEAALQRIDSPRPLTSAEAFKLLTLN
jgi:O-Antigen ligase